MIEREHDFVTHNWSYQGRSFQLIEETSRVASFSLESLNKLQDLIDLWS